VEESALFCTLLRQLHQQKRTRHVDFDRYIELSFKFKVGGTVDDYVQILFEFVAPSLLKHKVLTHLHKVRQSKKGLPN
jgi:hypothetical protein